MEDEAREVALVGIFPDHPAQVQGQLVLRLPGCPQRPAPAAAGPGGRDAVARVADHIEDDALEGEEEGRELVEGGEEAVQQDPADAALEALRAKEQPEALADDLQAVPQARVRGVGEHDREKRVQEQRHEHADLVDAPRDPRPAAEPRRRPAGPRTAPGRPEQALLLHVPRGPGGGGGRVHVEK